MEQLNFFNYNIFRYINCGKINKNFHKANINIPYIFNTAAILITDRCQIFLHLSQHLSTFLARYVYI